MSNLDMPLQDSTIMYQHLDGTQFVMVMVMFHSDSEVPKLMPIPPVMIIHCYLYTIQINLDFDF